MKKENLPCVISISAVSGGGKTTIATRLNKELKNSKALYFDDYDLNGPDDIIKWVDDGANYDIWDLDPFINDLETLLTEPLDYIVLDFPFAYKHTKTSKYIDFAVFIDTPLDVAMARRVTRDFKTSKIENVLVDMEYYVSKGRRGYIEMLKTIKPISDFIVDGTLPVSDIVKVITQNVRQYR